MVGSWATALSASSRRAGRSVLLRPYGAPSASPLPPVGGRGGAGGLLAPPARRPLTSLHGSGALGFSPHSRQGGALLGSLAPLARPAATRALATQAAANRGVADVAGPAAAAAAPRSALAADSGLSPTQRRRAVLDVVRQQVHSHTDAFYVVDLGEVARKYAQWRAELPRVRPFYAVKCNDDPRIVSTLASLGAGFDCASKGEMSMALGLGVRPEDVIFAHPAKQPTHLHYAASVGVKRMTFDNEDELRKIAAHYPGAEVVLRILADDSASVCRLGLKFGAPLSEVRHLLTVARDLGLAVAGVSYHVGSGNGSVQAFGDAVRDARAAFDIASSLGMKLTLLDIGGGFPGSEMGAAGGADRLPSRELDAANPYASAPSFTSIASVVRSALDTHFPEGCGVTLIAEPGRYFVKSSHVLAVNVIGKRRTADDDGAPRINYYVNDGLYGSFNCVLYDHVTCAPSLLLTNGDAAAEQAQAAANARARLHAHDDVIASLGPDGTPLVADALGLGAAAQLGSVAAAVAEEAQQQQQQQQVVRRVMTADGRVEEVAEAVTAAAGSGHAAGQPALVRSAAAGGAGRAAASAPRWSYRSLERDLATDAAAASASSPAAAAQPAVFNTTVWGPTCDSMDKVSDTLALPELAVGDWLVYENMGAYTIAGSCRFNGFPLTTKVYIDTDGSLQVTPEEA